ncbi:MAG: xanthine dehydrogenase family protein molybdopterin-binding subunit [Planctomycetota bacterium]|jgi:CO/xanthine dehydrogenase Mo-binding subunit
MPKYVGRPVRRIGGRERVTGKLAYAADMRIPGMLHAKLVTLDCAHARIVSINTSAAANLPGVQCILTAADLPQPVPRYGPVDNDRPVLAVGETKYYGEPVAAIAADSEEVAAEAADLVQVEYETLPGVYTVEDALATGAILVQDPTLRPRDPLRETNVYGEWNYHWGDAELSGADLVIENTYRFPMQSHFAIEPHVFIAAPGEPDGLVLWGTVQHPFVLQRAVAAAVDLPLAKVRVIATEMGGGFGGKGYPKFEPLVAFFALCTGRPVRLLMSLAESFLMGRRASSVVTMRNGFTADGHLVFVHSRADYLVGAYGDISKRIASKAAYVGCGAYSVPNLTVTARAIFSHTIPATAYRGFGAPQYLWALESQMDEGARRLDIDRLDIRLRNMPPKGAELVPGDTPVDGEWAEGLTMAAEAIGWGEPLAADRGRGLAIGIKTARSGATSQAIVRLHPDGSASVLVGTSEMGQGSQTVFAQVAAESLGVALNSVNVASGDTGRAPFDAITASSRSTICMGNAIVAACNDIKRKLADLAGELRGVAPEDVTVANGQVNVPGGALSYQEVIAGIYGPGEGEVIGVGEFRQARNKSHPLGGPVPVWEIIFFAAEVEVDKETGRYTVTKLTTVADIGKAINPEQVKGQDEGGALMSVGQALMEQLILDQDGVPANLGPLDYRIPTTRDVPLEVTSLLLENADGPGPFGAKGVGESGGIAAATAICSAVSQATGATFTELPITPERVWRGLRQQAVDASAAKK